MKKWLYRIIIAICLVVFGYSAFQLYSIYSEKHKIVKETNELKKLLPSKDQLEVDWDGLKAKNSDIIAWLYIPDCDISFPVVQGTDNSYYLHYDINHEANINGSVFLDYQADPFFQDDNSIVYGHSVDGGGMCTDLKNYAEEDFFKDHLEVYLLTPQENYIGRVFCFAKTEEDSVYYTCDFEEDGRDNVLKKMKEEALYSNEIDSNLKLVTISTCDLDYGFFSYHRMVLVVGLESTNQPIFVD